MNYTRLKIKKKRRQEVAEENLYTRSFNVISVTLFLIQSEFAINTSFHIVVQKPKQSSACSFYIPHILFLIVWSVAHQHDNWSACLKCWLPDIPQDLINHSAMPWIRSGNLHFHKFLRWFLDTLDFRNTSYNLLW